MLKRDGLKINQIGQSAAKSRIEKSSQTIPHGSRGKFPEVRGIHIG